MLRNRVREFRELYGLTQPQLAAAAGLVTRTIAQLETEPDYVPHGDTMVKLAIYFNCRLERLFWLETEGLPVRRRKSVSSKQSRDEAEAAEPAEPQTVLV